MTELDVADDALVALAFHDGAAAPDDVAVARARRVLRAPGGLARGYAVLDDVAAAALASGVNDAAFAESPLARLLAEETARVPRGLVARMPAMLPALAAAAACVCFVVLDNGDRRTKALVDVSAHPVAAVTVQRADGPLGEHGVMHGLEPRADALARCAPHRVEVRVRFRVRADGLVEGAVALPRGDAAACVGRVVSATAFDLHDDPTDVDASVVLHPEDE